MDPAYYVAASSLKARSFQLDTLANNLANTATVGYKPERSFFSVFNKAAQAGRELPLNRYVNDGTVYGDRGLDFQQAPFRETGQKLDVAIEGNAWFVLRTPAGERVTRDGRFRLGSGGRLESLEGFPVLGKNGQVISPDPAQGELWIGSDGTLSQNGTPIGQLELRAYAEPAALQREGTLLFDPAGARPAEVKAQVAQGYLEQSGVDMSALMVDMIRINRLYELSMKVASTLTNDLDARSINDIAIGR